MEPRYQIARGCDQSAPSDPPRRILWRRYAGEGALIQRCQLHKKRNVLDHFVEEHQGWVGQKLNEAYAMFEYADAHRALGRMHRERSELNPSTARSLAEVIEETLTVHRLRVPSLLRKTLASTNVIESIFAVVETVCRNVKRWRNGDHAGTVGRLPSWSPNGHSRRVRDYREVPQLFNHLSRLPHKEEVAKRAVAA